MTYSYDAPLWKRILKLLLICAVYFVLSLAVSAAVNAASVLFDLGSAAQYSLFQLLSALVSDAFTLIFLFAVKSRRAILSTLTPSFAGNNGRNVVFGLILGAAGYLVYLLVPLAAGGISLTFAPAKPWALILGVLAVPAMALSEELDNRVFLFQNLRMTFRSPVAAILIAGIWFTVSHGVTDILSLLFYLSGAAVFLLMVFCLESTWCAYAFHIVWNLLALVFGDGGEGTGLFVLTSGAREASSFFQPDWTLAGDLPGVIVNLILIAVILLKRYGTQRRRS